MHLNTLINLVANSLLICSSVHLLYKIFGNKNSKVWQTPYMAMLYKGVMGITICGAAANIITLSSPSWSEIVLNLGASGNWLFLSFYLYGYTSFTIQPVSRTVRVTKVKRKAISTNKRVKQNISTHEQL